MWRVIGRTAGVFASWGLVLIFAVGGGVQPHSAEAFSACGAGLTLFLWGVAVAFQERRMQAIAAAADATPERPRASA